MMAQEPLLGETLYPNLEMEDDSSDETLSLCDLPLYSNQSNVEEEWEEQDYLSSESSQAGSSSMSSSSQHDDYFEFFSQELITPNSSKAFAAPPENIIFCGKLIPYKQPNNPKGKEEEEEEEEEDKDHDEDKNKKLGILGMFGWKPFVAWGRLTSGSKQSKNGKRKSTTLKHKKGKATSRRHNTKKHGKKGHGFHVHKLPILSSSSSGRAWWHMFLFGISRFSTEVDLRDIKNRQSRRSHPSELPVTMLEPQNNDKNVGGVSRIGSGLWGLIRVLSCGGNPHPSTMVAASISCNSRE